MATQTAVRLRRDFIRHVVSKIESVRSTHLLEAERNTKYTRSNLCVLLIRPEFVTLLNTVGGKKSDTEGKCG